MTTPSEELRDSLIDRIEQVTKERDEARKVARELWLAIPSLMSELSGNGVADWGLINSAMVDCETMLRKMGEGAGGK